MPPSAPHDSSQLESFEELSPEQLGPRLQILKPSTNLALGGLLLLVFVAFLWGVFGRIPIDVQGQGMLIRSGSIVEIESTQAGPLSKIMVKAGQQVKAKQVLAQIAQPSLESEIAQAQERLGKLKNEYQSYLKFGDKNASLQNAKMQQERLSQQQSIQ